MIKMILCTDVNNGIGNNNSIPWHSSADFRHFKNETIGETVIMGYNTFLSLGKKPLPNRTNIVIDTKCIEIEPQDNLQVLALDSYDDLKEYFSTNPDVIIIGGSKVYAECIKYCDLIIKSTIHGNYECDRFFDIHSYGIDFEVKSSKTLEDDTKVEYFVRKQNV